MSIQRHFLYASQFEKLRDRIFEFIRDGKLTVTLDWNRSPTSVDSPQDKFIYVLSGDYVDEILPFIN